MSDQTPAPEPEDEDPYAGLDALGAEPEEQLPEDEAIAAKLQEASAYDLNDDGNGRRFVLYYGEDLMWVPRVGWFKWTGKVWQSDPDEIALRRLSQAAGQLVKREVAFLRLSDHKMQILAMGDPLRLELVQLEALRGEDGKLPDAAEARRREIDRDLIQIKGLQKSLSDIRAAHRRFALQCGNSKRMKDMREEASVRLSRQLDELDAEPWDVNTETGVVRFVVHSGGDAGYSKTADVQVLPHDRGFLMTKIMDVRYDPKAEAPRFEAFLQRIQPEPEMRSFLMRWFALGMVGITEQKLAFFYGMGANGKSVLVDLMARILGDYAATAKIESLTGTNRRGGGDATPDLVPLIGARMVRAAEPDEGVRWQEGLIKDLTGGEPLLIRALHSDFVEVRPQFTLTISGNHKPDIRGTDDGIWRRLLLVPFDVSIPKAEQIPKAELDAILYAERDGVFRLLCEALCDYRESGLREPASVLDATAEFRQESDPVGTFLNEACVVTGDAEHTVIARELVFAFQFWQQDQGMGPWKDRSVSLKLEGHSKRWVSRLGTRFSKRKSSGTMRYDGIQLNAVFAKKWERVPKNTEGRAIGTVSDDSEPSSQAGDY